MINFKLPDLEDRRSSAATAKKMLLEKFRAASNDPALAQRKAERQKIVEARNERIAEREAARRAREAELAEQARIAAEAAARAQREAEELAAKKQREAEELAALIAAEEAERETKLLAEQKAARDARYAARKAARKERRRGYRYSSVGTQLHKVLSPCVTPVCRSRPSP